MSAGFPSVAGRIATRRFRAMGCHATVAVVSGGDVLATRLADRAERRIFHLERCWTRFDDCSDLSAINRAEGRVVMVDPSTVELIRTMVVAHRITGGSCDPSHRSEPRLEPGAFEKIWIDDLRHLVRVPAGLELDPGSVGKGLAADLVAAQAMNAGASGVIVEIGGDLRAMGVGPHLGFWPIAVEDPFGDSTGRGSILVQNAGVSTSGLPVSPEITGPDNVSVDPRTRRPLAAEPERVVSATVVAGSAAEAEMWSTALLVDGKADLEPVIRRGGLARVTWANRDTHACDTWKRIFTANADLEEVACV